MSDKSKQHMKDDKRQHLEFIQNIITRMNTNSFQIKSLAITIVTALMAVYAATPKTIFIFLGIPTTLLFWFLDSYYLQQERKFRGVYEDVAGLTNEVKVKPYEMPIKEYTKKINDDYSYWNSFKSPTVKFLYLSIIIILLIIGISLKLKSCIN